MSNLRAFPVLDDTNYHDYGMTLRDYFAAAALSNPNLIRSSEDSFAAQDAYDIADAMIEERLKHV